MPQEPADQIETALAADSRLLLDASRALGLTRWASIARAWCVPYLFSGMEQVFASNREPVAGIIGLFGKLSSSLQSAATNDIDQPESLSAQTGTEGEIEQATIEELTGKHYGRLFQAFSRSSFWDEPALLLRTRLERNDIDVSRLSKREVLDAGCGGGRYSVAWRLIGAGSVVGVDISSLGIASARQRVDEVGLDGISFLKGSVLELAFADDGFDVVFSNGVLHHTMDWKKGVAELVRVLKPGGTGWLYLIENPGGLFWAVIEVLREMMKDEDREFARISLQMLGIPDNRIFYMLDHVMAPINLRLTPGEIEQSLLSAGATQIRRLSRGADFDRIERIYQKEPFAEAKYGIGENRYVFTKK
jgi:ubiquinone/menaquinone biosynthesis C-methylase UbiE